jgi:rRNA maturation endonuclease Nob1
MNQNFVLFKYVTESESSSDEDEELENLTAEQNRQLALLQEMEEVPIIINVYSVYNLSKKQLCKNRGKLVGILYII